MSALPYFAQQTLKDDACRESVSEDCFKAALHIDYWNCHLICCIAIHSSLTISLALLLIAVILPYIICIYGVTIKYVCAHEMLICRVNVKLNKMHLPEASRNADLRASHPLPLTLSFCLFIDFITSVSLLYLNLCQSSPLLQYADFTFYYVRDKTHNNKTREAIPGRCWRHSLTLRVCQSVIAPAFGCGNVALSSMKETGARWLT